MKTKLKALSLAVTLMVAGVGFTEAAVVGVVETDNYNTINGLDWLDLDVTDGMSVDEALFAWGEWRLATESEYSEMFGRFSTVGDGTFLGREATKEIRVNDEYDDTYYVGGLGDLNVFGETFGITASIDNAYRSYGKYVGEFGGFRGCC